MPAGAKPWFAALHTVVWLAALGVVFWAGLFFGPLDSCRHTVYLPEVLNPAPESINDMIEAELRRALAKGDR